MSRPLPTGEVVDQSQREFFAKLQLFPRGGVVSSAVTMDNPRVDDAIIKNAQKHLDPPSVVASVANCIIALMLIVMIDRAHAFPILLHNHRCWDTLCL